MLMRKFGIVVALSTAFSFGMGSSNVPPLVEIDENERAMSHVNYIQYELAKIRTSGDKLTVVKEMDNILNTINPTSLKHQKLIDAYRNILIGMEELRASDTQLDLLAKEIEQKRKNAIFNSFSGLGASFLNPNPVSLVSALVMSGFNYARTVNEIDAEKGASDLKINDTKKATINEERIKLWTSASEVFKDYKYESTTFINEKMMDNYIKEDFKLEEKPSESKARSVYAYLTLPEVENQFRFFIPYYVTLMKAGYYENDAVKVKKNYKKIVDLSNAEYSHFYTKNPYLYEATKYALLYLMNHQEERLDDLPIGDMIGFFKKEGDKSRVSVVEDEYFLIGVYEYLNQKKKGEYYSKIKENLNRLKDLGVENDTTDLYSKYKCMESKERDNDYCYRLSKKIAEDLLLKASYKFEDDGSFKILFPIDADVEVLCADLDQETIYWGALDRREERKKCFSVVKNISKQKVGDVYVFSAENVGKLEYEKLKVNLKFKMEKWFGVAECVADFREKNQRFELKVFEK